MLAPRALEYREHCVALTLHAPPAARHACTLEYVACAGTGPAAAVAAWHFSYSLPAALPKPSSGHAVNAVCVCVSAGEKVWLASPWDGCRDVNCEDSVFIQFVDEVHAYLS